MKMQLPQTLVQLMVPTIVSDQNLGGRVVEVLKFGLLSELEKMKS